MVSLANFVAEPGRVYYFRVRTSGGPDSLMSGKGSHADYQAAIDLDPVNTDEGKLLVASSSRSISQPKAQRASK